MWSDFIGYGHHMQAIGQGDVNAEMLYDGKWTVNYLKDIWYVHETGRNLFLISYALHKGMTAIINHNRCLLLRNKDVVVYAERSDGSYYACE